MRCDTPSRRHSNNSSLQNGARRHALFQKAESFLNRWAQNYFSNSLEQAIEAAMQPTFDRLHAELSDLKARAGIADKGTAPRVDVNVSLASLGVRTPLSIAGGVARQPPEKSIEERLNEVETQSQAEELWRTSPTIRDEFESSANMWAYCQASKKGLIHWHRQKPSPQRTAIAVSDETLTSISTSEQAAELWNNSPKVREEFESVTSLWACIQAMQSGRARIFRADRAGVVK
jgi:hypothetical protein